MATIKNLKLIDEFRGINLGDKRLDNRCVELVKDLGKHPDESIPKSCVEWSSIKAAYRFFENKNVTREALLKPHRNRTIERIHERKDVLAIQDTTYLNFTAHPDTEDLGPIGTSPGLQGLVVHNTMAVEAETGEILGLLNQEVWARDKKRYPKEESTFQRRQRSRESERWPRNVREVEAMGLTNIIHVTDREGDIYEMLEALDSGQRFVIRARHNRLLSEEAFVLFDKVRQQKPIGEMSVDVPRRPGQRARKAILRIRRSSVGIRPPNALRRKGSVIEVKVVELHEPDAPKGGKALHWILLTSEPVETVEQCQRVAHLYRQRWKIEEFHKCLKTGCQIEQRQLKTRQRLEAALGVYSVIGMMLLRMREAARDTKEKARSYLNEVQLKILRHRFPKIGKDPTARDAFRAGAQLGGFIGRKHDGEPGWKTLWLGMNDLMMMEHGHYSLS